MGKTKSFGDCAQLIKDLYNPSKNEFVPYVGLEHIEQNTLRLNSIGNSSKVVSQKFKFQQNDILFGKLRPYFRKVVQPDFDGVCSTDIFVVRAKSGIDQDFLYYWMASLDFVDYSSKGSEGTKMPRAKWEFLERFTRFVPDIDGQTSIANILKSLDKKIQNNILQNIVLEKIIQSIFKSWFVDFDGVTEFEDSELGKIPKGWKSKQINELIDEKIIDKNQDGNHGEKHPKTSDFVKDGIPFIMASNLINNILDLKNCYFLTKEKADSLRIGFSKSGDVLLTHKASLGRVDIVPKVKNYVMLSPQVTYYRILDPNTLSNIFLKYYFISNYFQNQLFGSSSQSTRDYVGITSQRECYILIPSSSMMKKFTDIVSPIYHKIQLQNKFTHKLSQIRDSLLPKLMSGEIRI